MIRKLRHLSTKFCVCQKDHSGRLFTPQTNTAVRVCLARTALIKVRRGWVKSSAGILVRPLTDFKINQLGKQLFFLIILRFQYPLLADNNRFLESTYLHLNKAFFNRGNLNYQIASGPRQRHLVTLANEIDSAFNLKPNELL